ncbi:MAG: uracil-DNA glycosylase family protein [Alphaproteobacteria bacterium]|nr:uracil-DNA glycosylase family protein [Alphaproteobacteria bacterium]
MPEAVTPTPETLSELLKRIGKCRICIDEPVGEPLPHEPRPVLQAHPAARLAIFGQAPGLKVHKAGKPFMDPSGVRLRSWLGIDEGVFYDASRVAIVPMGFCFPGYDAKGGDLPPRKECAGAWRARLLEKLPNLELALLIGQYAQAWHLEPERRRGSLTSRVSQWRTFLDQGETPRFLPLPHPSWRNNAWLARNPWFEAELLPELRGLVGRVLNCR